MELYLDGSNLGNCVAPAEVISKYNEKERLGLAQFKRSAPAEDNVLQLGVGWILILITQLWFPVWLALHSPPWAVSPDQYASKFASA